MLIRDAEPLRLHDLGDDPRSVGFPANHPPMRSFLGVPILLRGVAYGNLYLTEKGGGGDFTDEDEELTQLLAAQAAVAIENTRLYETSTRWLRHFESLSEIGDALAGELELEPLLGLVARRLRSLIQARLVLIALPEAGAEELRITAADGEGSDAYGLVGIELELGGSKTGRVLQRGVASGSIPSSTIPRSTSRSLAGWACGPRCTSRLSSEGGRWASSSRTTSWARRSSFTDDDVRLAESLATRAATAVDLSSASAVMPSDASSRPRSSSVLDWHASSTTRRGRR